MEQKPRKKVSLFKQNIQKIKASQNQNNNAESNNKNLNNQQNFPVSVKLQSYQRNDEQQNEEEEYGNETLNQANFKNQRNINQNQNQFQNKNINQNQNDTSKIKVSPEEYQDINKQNLEFINSLSEKQVKAYQEEIMKEFSPNLVEKFKQKEFLEVFDNSKQNRLNAATVSQNDEDINQSDGYNLDIENYIQENPQEIQKIFNINPVETKDLISKMCFNVNGELLLESTEQSHLKKLKKKIDLEIKKENNEENWEQNPQFLQFYDLEIILNLLTTNSEYSFNHSIATELISKILDQFTKHIKQNKEEQFDQIYQEQEIIVYRLDFVKYLEDKLTLTYRLIDLLRSSKNISVSLNSFSTLVKYLQFQVGQETLIPQHFNVPYKIIFNTQQERAKKLVNIIRDMFLIEHSKNFLLKIEDPNHLQHLLPEIISLLEILFFLDSEVYQKQIISSKFMEVLKKKIPLLAENQQDLCLTLTHKLEYLQFINIIQKHKKQEHLRYYHRNEFTLQILKQHKFNIEEISFQDLEFYGNLKILQQENSPNKQKIFKKIIEQPKIQQKIFLTDLPNLLQFYTEITLLKKNLPSKTQKNQVIFLEQANFYFEDFLILVKDLFLLENLPLQEENDEFLVIYSIYLLLRETKNYSLISPFVLNFENWKKKQQKLKTDLNSETLKFLSKNNNQLKNSIQLENLVEILQKTLNFLQKQNNLLLPEKIFTLNLIRALKIFLDTENLGFLTFEKQEMLTKYFQTLTSKSDPYILNTIFQKDPEFIGALITSYNYSSYGNQAFTNIMFYFVNPRYFDLELQLCYKQLCLLIPIRNQNPVYFLK
ncbi:hypothetical protein PPERSA_08793 [Pseudocohnilembus persalinus]|uniref:RPAP1 N-terminal domain-containing protein n=1 Tax=Pseudocohnilembus persalinus TaxID=266149 RepID=A0A0V0R7P2_PSEPJ|nr:hypothetical protein PPERSA_08793 [Pseudocohnilembus persalinus]|eukprot:KRX10491.1 hypothetical protein PPERSA_08793 [Pseudocohnilembus persalinus]